MSEPPEDRTGPGQRPESYFRAAQDGTRLADVEELGDDLAAATGLDEALLTGSARASSPTTFAALLSSGASFKCPPYPAAAILQVLAGVTVASRADQLSGVVL
jgi:hypothetical protein